MWISSGYDELTENIVHLVLAKDSRAGRQADPGREGHFAVHRARKLVEADGDFTGQRNDMALAGLNHKLGWRGTTNTLLNFGERQIPGARQRRRHRLPGGQAARGASNACST